MVRPGTHVSRNQYVSAQTQTIRTRTGFGIKLDKEIAGCQEG